MSMETVIKIDASSIYLVDIPHYCRNVADKVRWLAWTLGMIKTIRQRDEVRHDLNTNSHILTILS